MNRDVRRLLPMKNASQIRDMLLERLLVCLRAPSMCGGELGVLNLMEYLTFIDDREDEWKAQRSALNESGAFGSTGVHAGFWSATRQTKHNDSQVASVYALIAYEMGYLNADSFARILTPNEYSQLLGKLDDAFLAKNQTNAEIIEEFGIPSMRWGTNDNYPCFLLYIDSSSPLRFCYFDCWAEFHKDESGCMVPGKYGPSPILRNIRIPSKTFVDQFRFTTFGKRLKAKSVKRKHRNKNGG